VGLVVLGLVIVVLVVFGAISLWGW
jgi:hypothetical protein